jgi:hypothetical protein|tara:strand:- start:2375 stop:2599 length:225 start_codon:yes stop_codon:yes gene_type:complete
MQFKFTETHLKLKFSWKEILMIILRRGHFLMERKSCYEFMTVLAGVINKAIIKYGGAEEHGHLVEYDHPDNYEE